MAGSGRRLLEIVSSPLSNLTGINSLATARAEAPPAWFPNRQMVGVAPQQVIYHSDYQVPVAAGQPGSSYWRDRTMEHFLTLSFQRQAKGVELRVQGWLVREQGADGLPAAAFAQPFVTLLS